MSNHKKAYEAELLLSICEEEEKPFIHDTLAYLNALGASA